MGSLNRIDRIAAWLGIISLGCGTAAVAQWNPQMTADLGLGYGQIALSQSILSGTRRIGSGDQTGNATASAGATQAATLVYAQDPRVSAQTRAMMVDALSRHNPALRAQVDGALRGDMVLEIFDRAMSSHGLFSRNVADDMAVRLVNAWEIVTGGSATPQQIRGLDIQVRGVFLSTPQLRAMTNVERQRLAENIAYQVVIGAAANLQFQRTGNQAQLVRLRETEQTILRDLGVDLSRLRLTDRGFMKNS